MSSAGVSSAEVWKTWEGRVVDGKYPLRQWLGGSDHSAVFLTEQLGQPPLKAALKLIPADAGDADRQLARWRTATQLGHPHLIRILETGRCGLTLLYVVMEFAEEDLSQILPQRALEPAEVTDLLPPVLDALAYLHSRGFVHGRIKPSNVLAVGDQLKLSADQAELWTEMHPSRRRRDVYDAPETAAGIVSPAGDLWSVGVTLVAALTQNVSFVGEAEHGGPKLPATMTEPFRGIASECLHLDPKRRCSIAEIKARLQPAARSVPVVEEAVPAPARPMKRGPIAAALLVTALVVGTIFFYLRGKSVTPPTQSATNQTATEKSETKQAVLKPAPARSVPAPIAPATTPTPPVSKPAEPAKKAVASRGEVLHQVLPDVPQSAKNTITGTIKVGVRVEVDPSGKVTTAKLFSPGPSKYFAKLAVEAAQRWEFSPPAVDGQPTKSAWVLRFRFKRTSTQASPERARD